MHDNLTRRPYKKKPVIDRFLGFIEKTPTCWIWTGPKMWQGYGVLEVDYKCKRANRLSWEIHNGPIPEGQVVCHQCDNPICVNPGHLFLGTLGDNIHDAMKKGRFIRGETQGHHKLTEKQVIEMRKIHSNGELGCRKLAKLYGICKATCQKVINRETWKHI